MAKEYYRDSIVDDTNKSLARVEHARGAYLQAENDFVVAKRSYAVSQEKHDISMGHILDMFQDKEKNKRIEVKKVFQRVVKLLLTYQVNMERQCNEIIAKTNNVNFLQDLGEFVLKTYNDNTPAHVRWTRTEKVDLLTNLCDITTSTEIRQNCFDHLLEFMQQGQAYVKMLLQLNEERLSLEDGVVKLLRKRGWNINTAWTCSMSKAFVSWNRLMTGAASSGEKYISETRSKVHAGLVQLASHLKNNYSSILRQYEKLIGDVKPIYAVYEKSIADCNKANQALENARDKLRKSDVTAADHRKSTIMTIIQGNAEKLQQKVQTAETEAKNAELDKDRTSKLLAKTKEMEVKRFTQIINAIREMEEHRVNSIKELISIWGQLLL